MTLESRRLPAWARSQAKLLVAACLLLTAIDGTAAAAAATRHAPTRRPGSLRAVAVRATRADRTLVADAKALVACVRATRTPTGCRAAHNVLQLAGTNLRRSERQLASVARAQRKARAVAASSSRAPRLKVNGERLKWTRVGHVKSYVLMRDVAGQESQYSLVSGTSTTPPPVPGATVTYAVRTAVDWSSWSSHRTITYPSPRGTSPAPPASPPETIDTQSAPTITVSGRTLRWTAIAGVSTYVLVSRVTGQAEKFTSVSGTSVTPPAVPGATVYYSVRTAVDGSAWSAEVAISYPSPPPTPAPPPTEPTPPKESPAPGPGSFQFGINAGMEPTDGAAASKLGAKVVRIDFGITTTAAQMEPVIAGYAARGIRVAPLAGFYGGMPTPAEAQGLAGWARAYGPGGSFWAAHGNGQLAIQTIEFGNETSGGYQYGDNPGEPSYQTRAKTYAVRFKEAAEAISASGMKVGLLAVSEDWTGNWMNGMFSAVPNFASYVAGWVSHPYGPGWRTKIDDIISQAAAHGAPSTIPIDITEWGLSSDNTSCVDDNFEYSTCMTYAQAAETARKTVNEIGALLGSRSGLFMLYKDRDQALPGASNDREYYMGALGPELQSKGAYTEAVEELLAS
ncbi:MAG TPA: hypothetical protein VK721_06740 [Solirubrobacteraceae bacterium]|jgi:hypothetical protein|nr:hypothetical protein [Solirubrobacteraceae bacterium]